MTMTNLTTRLRVNPIACSGHGVCAELLPELITLDEWGYPLVADGGLISASLARITRRAVADCPALALSLVPGSLVPGETARRGNSEEAQMPAGAGTGRIGT
jgi:ferredoxin